MKKRFFMMAIFLLTAAILSHCGGGAKTSLDIPRFDAGDNQMIFFDFTASKNVLLKSNVTGIIKDNAISLEVPYGTNVNSLIAEYTTNSTDVRINDIVQKSGETPNSFASPVVISVYNKAAEKKDYTVTVTIAPSSDKEITAFSINGVVGARNETAGTISVTLPPKTAITAVPAVFSSTTLKSVTVGGIAQVSGTTKNDFSSPVSYLVTADDTSTKTYVVTVTVLPSPINEITSFSFLKTQNPSLASDITGIRTGNDIALILPYGTSPANLIAAFITEAQTVSVNSQNQSTTVTANNFTSPLVYHCVAEDTSTRDYTVTVTVAKNSAKAITSFSIEGDTGVIDESAKTVKVTVAANRVMTSRIANFTTTGSSVTINSLVQNSGVTLNDFSSPLGYLVIADDTTTSGYTVSIARSPELIGQWDFGTTTDGSYANTGALVTPGINGNALQFNGYSDYVTVPDSTSLTLAQSGSIEVFIKAISHKPYAGIVHKGVKADFSDESYSLQFWGAGGVDGTVRFSIMGDSGAYGYTDSATKIQIGQWYHLVATWDSTKLKIYINGALNSSSDNTVGNVRDSSGALVIGAQLNNMMNASWGDLGFNGVIEDVNIFNRALTAEEISVRAQSLNAGSTSVAAYLLSVPGRNLPFTLGLLALFLALLSGLYVFNRKRAHAQK